MANRVDSYKYLDRSVSRLVKSWIAREPARDIPWTPLAKPVSECNVAFVSTAAVAMRDDEPFDQEGERRDPWWGDPSHRVIPRSATERDVGVHHLHIDPMYAERDLGCILPMQRLAELVDAGEVGGVAPSHYSFMGYLLRPQQLLDEGVPAMVERMRAEAVDAVVLVPV